MSRIEVILCKDLDDLSDKIVKLVCHVKPKVFGVSGGTTYTKVYESLNAKHCDDDFWRALSLVLVDERWVLPDDPESNLGLLLSTLLKDVRPKDLIFPDTTKDRDNALSEFEAKLKTALEKKPSLALLGIGEDGHTASLFPGSCVNDDRLAIFVDNAPKPPPKRVSLTFKALSMFDTVVLAASGYPKSSSVQRILDGDTTIPAARIRGIERTLLFIDEQAASLSRYISKEL